MRPFPIDITDDLDDTVKMAGHPYTMPSLIDQHSYSPLTRSLL